MEFPEFDTYLAAIDNKFESSSIELRECFREHTNWLEEIRIEAEKRTAKSSFLLPKTPSAKKRKRRIPLETVPEGECTLDSNACADSPRRTRSTRITRNTTIRNIDLENILLETGGARTRRAASRNAGQKIKAQVSEKLPQESDVEDLEELVKGTSNQEVEGQQPSKSRHIHESTEIKSMFPLIEKLNDTRRKGTDSEALIVDKSPEVKLMIPSVDRFTRSKVSHTLKTSVDVFAETSMVPLVEKLNIRGSVNHAVVSSSENKREIDNQLSEYSDVLTSTVTSTSTEPSHRVLQSKNSIENDEYSRNCSTNSLKDFTENNVAARDSLSVCENSKEAKNVANITITMESKNKANITFEIVPDENSDSVHASVAKIQAEPSPKSSQGLKDVKSESVNVEASRKMQSPVLSKTRNISRFDDNSMSQATITKLMEKKSAEIFSPYANEPVCERVAAFERLQAVSEEPAQSLPCEKSPVRITRTKTRAMAKAEAAAAAKSENTDINTKEVNDNTAKNLYSQNIWKAARKSVAKAKKRSFKSQMQEKVVDESEMSKENSIIISTSKYTTPLCNANRNTPLSSSNISNTNSANRMFGFGSSAERFPVNKQVGNIVVGVESFITKPTVKLILEDVREMKEEELRRREEKADEAKRKREEALKRTIEERKRKREQKLLKVLQHKALEKQKLDIELRQQKEKEEKLKMTIQKREEKLKEQLMQKKQQAQQKAAEIEERRRLEEMARLAKLKEQEEEQRRLQAAKKKEQEEHAKWLAEQKEAAALREQLAVKLCEAKMKEKEEMKFKVPPKPGLMDKTFEIGGTSGKQKACDYDDYGIDSSDCSDEEDLPMRPMPLWARKEKRVPVLKAQRYSSKRCYNIFVYEQTTPDLRLLFSQYNIKQRKRTSSAVWQTPPRYSQLPKY